MELLRVWLRTGRAQSDTGASEWLYTIAAIESSSSLQASQYKNLHSAMVEPICALKFKRKEKAQIAKTSSNGCHCAKDGRVTEYMQCMDH